MFSREVAYGLGGRVPREDLASRAGSGEGQRGVSDAKCCGVSEKSEPLLTPTIVSDSSTSFPSMHPTTEVNSYDSNMLLILWASSDSSTNTNVVGKLETTDTHRKENRKPPISQQPETTS